MQLMPGKPFYVRYSQFVLVKAYSLFASNNVNLTLKCFTGLSVKFDGCQCNMAGFTGVHLLHAYFNKQRV